MEPIDNLIRRAAPQPDAGVCTRTPEFDVGRLVALGRGTPDPEAETHLADCAFCRALVRDVAEPPSALLLARMKRAAPSAPRGLASWAGAAAVLAAAAALAIVLLRPLSPLPEYVVQGPLGGVTQVRGDEESSDVFVPESQLLLVLRPHRAVETPDAALFVAEPGGALRRLPDALLKREPNGAFLLRSDCRALFGETPGRKHVYVVLSRSVEQLESLAGERAPAAGERGGMSWYEVELEYRLAP